MRMKIISGYWIINGIKRYIEMHKETTDLEAVRNSLAELHKIKRYDIAFNFYEK